MAAMATDVSMVDMAVTDTARGALRLRPMPSQAMDTTAVDTDMAVMDTDVSMGDMGDTDTERGALMPWLWRLWRLWLWTCLWWIRQILRINSIYSSFLYSDIHSCSKIESCFTSKFHEIKVSKKKA